MIKPDIVSLSPNFNNAPVRGHTVIIHATRSGTAGNSSEFVGTLHYMGTPGTTSSHWVISRKGEKARVVPDNRQAWHAAEDNDNAWGIELEQGVELDGFTIPQIIACAEVCAGYVQDFGVSIAHCKTSEEAGFIGHQETVQGRRDGKSDPGRFFPWEAFITALKRGLPMEVIRKEGNFVIINNGPDVVRVGSTDGQFPGRLSKLFGDTWWWLRKADAPDDELSVAYWSKEEGD